MIIGGSLQGLLGTADRVLLGRAAATASELVALHRRRVASEEAAHAELERLTEAKAADLARCKARLQACEAAAAELQRKQAEAGPTAGAALSPAASLDPVRFFCLMSPANLPCRGTRRTGATRLDVVSHIGISVEWKAQTAVYNV